MFQGWENFYYLMGSAAAGLIGLMFVAVSLTRNFEPEKAERGQRLFMTPTVMQFAIVLAVAGLALAPRLTPEAHRWAMGAVAGWGLVYTAPSAVRLARSQNTAHWSDFWFYGFAPTAIYVVSEIAIADWLMLRNLSCNLMALCLLALLMVSIRNAWDLVTWIAPRRKQTPETTP
jgi:uncharacterized membrane protein